MGATILILDSDRKSVGRLRTLLSAHGYTVLSASNVVEGRSILAEFRDRIQIVIIGLGLPDTTVPKIIDSVARLKSGSKPKVIVTSEEQDREAYLYADRAVVKPGTDQDWLTAVAVLLDGVAAPDRRADSVADVELYGADDPFVGVWKVNMAKSTYDETEKPCYTDQVWLRAPSGKTTIKATNTDGKLEVVSFSPIPGKAVPIEGMKNCTVTETRPAFRTIEHIWKCRTYTVRDEIVIAEDGRTLWFTTTGQNTEGQPWRWVELFDKQ